MASAAAVGADAARSPLPNDDLNDTVSSIVGTIAQAENLQSDGSASEDGGVVARRGPRKGLTNGLKSRSVQDEDEEMDNADNDDDAGLFGSESEDDEVPTRRRPDDEDLDSGDDLDREDRRNEEDAYEHEQRLPKVEETMELDLGRAAGPEPSDGELYLLRMPEFVAIDPFHFKQSTFKPPTTDHHSKSDPSSTFSAYNTAMTTIRWRRSPNNPSRLQSNARVVRWSDGSLTLQFASRPGTHYPMAASATVPPRTNTSKPTPTNKAGQKKSVAYDPEKDQFTYLAAPQELAGMLRVTNRVTANLKVQSATDGSSEALERLQNSLAAAATRKNEQGNSATGISMVRITEDPELAKKKAEVAEKEKVKAQKRREAQELRSLQKQGRAIGGRGLGTGLTVGGLEDDDEGLTRLPGLGGNRKKKARSSRRGEIYSDDESDFGRRGRTREDEYDADDGFLAPSDEEEEDVVGDESESDAEEERMPRSRPLVPRQSTPKRVLDDAEGDLDDGDDVSRLLGASPSTRNKRRKIIDDDDDE